MSEVLFMATPYKLDGNHNQKKAIVQKLLDSMGIALLVANDNPEKKSMTVEQTIQWMSSSDYFLVDLSYERPSCYYELGYIQSMNMNKSTLIIARKGEKIHMSLNRSNISFYENLSDYKAIIEKWLSLF